MSKSRTAILGYGAIAATHVDAIRSGDYTEITAICDIRRDRLEAAQKDFPNANIFEDYHALLESGTADVIHICTPHYLHMPMAIKALETGHDVYLEKPAGMNSAEIERIIAASERTGKRVAVSFQNRVTPANAAAKEILDSGELGRFIGMKGLVTWFREGAYYTESGWRGTWAREGGGLLMNQSIHTLDLMYYFGGPFDRVEGTASLRSNRGTIEVEDTAEATFYYKNGGRGVFYATNCYVTNSPVEVEIVCEKGTLLIRDDTLYRKIGREITRVAANDDLQVGKDYWGVGHAIMIQNFYSALRGGADYFCDIRDAAPSMAAIEQIYHNNFPIHRQ